MGAINEGGYVTLAELALSTTGKVAAPGSGATITLWASNANNTAAGKGARYKMFVINIYSSHASAASGLVISESSDKGVTWDSLSTASVSATTYTKTYFKASAPDIKIEYTNSANVLTTWRGSVMGDPMERSNG